MMYLRSAPLFFLVALLCGLSSCLRGGESLPVEGRWVLDKKKIEKEFLKYWQKEGFFRGMGLEEAKKEGELAFRDMFKKLDKGEEGADVRKSFEKTRGKALEGNNPWFGLFNPFYDLNLIVKSDNTWIAFAGKDERSQNHRFGGEWVNEGGKVLFYIRERERGPKLFMVASIEGLEMVGRFPSVGMKNAKTGFKENGGMPFIFLKKIRPQ